MERLDTEIVKVLNARLHITRLIFYIKTKNKIPLIRPEVEERRLKAVYDLAKEIGHPDPNFVRSLFEIIIKDSKSFQLSLLEEQKTAK